MLLKIFKPTRDILISTTIDNTWERHPDNFSDKSKTTKDPTKTAQYSSTSIAVNPAKIQTSTILKQCK